MSSTVKAGSEQYAVVSSEEPMVEGVFVSGSGLVAPAPAAAGRAATGETVSIVAPTNLPGGYEFAAFLDGETVTVKVPPAGVVQGQTFTAPIVEQSISHDIPTGRWRDGQLDFCANGCCDSMMWCGWWCHICALGQVMTRMKLDLWGRQSHQIGAAYWTPFKVLSLLATGNFLIPYIAAILLGGLVASSSGQQLLMSLTQLARLGFFIYVLILMTLTRKYIRERYQIPIYSCGRFEDVCCSFWFPCCTVLHMARQTADYKRYESTCCTDTGLLPSAPRVV